MKKIISIFMFFAFTCIQAQESLLNFKEENLLINGVSVNVGKVILKGDVNQVSKYWKHFVKKQNKQRVREVDGILTAKETVVNQITDKRGDLLAYIYIDDNSVSFNIAFKLGYDIYLNSNEYPDEFAKLKIYTNNFVKKYYLDFLPKHIKSKNKVLKGFKKESSKSQKIIKKANSENEGLEKKNRKLAEQISNEDKKIAVTSNPAIKSKLLNKQKEYNQTIENNNQIIKNNKELINTQTAIIKLLSPKMDSLSKEINSLNITLFEVKAKS